MNSSYTIPVHHSSFEDLQEAGWEAHDNGFASNNYVSTLATKDLIKVLTKKQQMVLSELMQGKSRKDIALKIMVSEQALHQIVIRIRKRLHDKAGISLKGWKRKHGGY